MSCGYAAHVENMGSFWLPIFSTIACKTLRVSHISTKPATAAFSFPIKQKMTKEVLPILPLVY